MTSPKQKEPIESFGPELMQALVAGGRGIVRIPFRGEGGSGKRLAHSFMRRIHTLRQRMRELDHPDFAVASRAKVGLCLGSSAVARGAPKEWEGDEAGRKGALVYISPKDSEFAGILTKAGINLDGASPPTIDELEPVTPTSDLDDFVDELKELQPRREFEK